MNHSNHPPQDELVLTHVTARFSGAIGELQLTRSETRNAINQEMGEEILLACRWLDGERQLKAVVLHGAGSVFCAGLDLAMVQNGISAQLRVTVDLTNQIVERMAGMKAIVVGSIHGACLGAPGLMLAAACDLRYAARDTRFQLPEAEFGIPVMHTALRFLARDLGPAGALAPALLQTPVSAQYLYDTAFLNGVCAPGRTLETARFTAAKLAGKPALLLQKMKQHLATSRNELIRATERYHQQFVEQAKSVFNDPESIRLRTRHLRQPGQRTGS